MTSSIVLALVCVLAAPALADPTADARAHSEAFARAWNAGDLQGALALYADDAIAIWPGQREEAKGKAAIEGLLREVFERTKDRKLALESIEGRALGEGHIATIGHWESAFTTPRGRRVTARLRTTEVLVKADGGWRYLVDHASIGQPRPVAARRGRRMR
jgi:uncharacterized protein (TIGR02246 family)